MVRRASYYSRLQRKRNKTEKYDPDRTPKEEVGVGVNVRTVQEYFKCGPEQAEHLMKLLREAGTPEEKIEACFEKVEITRLIKFERMYRDQKGKE